MRRTCPGCGAVNRIPPEHLHQTGRCGSCKASLPRSTAPLVITDITMFDQLIAKARVPVLVDFWAEWCGPCRMVAPEVSRVANELAGEALVAKVNSDDLPQLSARYRVQGIPNFVVFVDGRVAKQQAGAMRAADLVRLVQGAKAA